ncbi:unnamed protein product [Ixodes persulcatus]
MILYYGRPYTDSAVEATRLADQSQASLSPIHPSLLRGLKRDHVAKGSAYDWSNEHLGTTPLSA